MIGASRSGAAGGCGAPPHLAAATLASAVFSIPAVLLFLLPGAAGWFEYDREALAAGQLWRVVGCHWTHWSFDHLAWDLLAFAVLVLIGWSRSPRRSLAVLALSTVAIPLVVFIALPEMALYRGLSGIDSALFMLVALVKLRDALAARRGGVALAVAFLIAGFLGKIVFEIVTQTTLFADSSEFVPVPLAQLFCAACAIVVFTTIDLARRSGPKPHRFQNSTNRTVKTVVTAS